MINLCWRRTTFINNQTYIQKPVDHLLTNIQTQAVKTQRRVKLNVTQLLLSAAGLQKRVEKSKRLVSEREKKKFGIQRSSSEQDERPTVCFMIHNYKRSLMCVCDVSKLIIWSTNQHTQQMSVFYLYVQVNSLFIMIYILWINIQRTLLYRRCRLSYIKTLFHVL